MATTQPIVYTGDRNSAIVLATGRRHSTAGAATAPRYLSKKPITDMSAVTKAMQQPELDGKRQAAKRRRPDIARR